MIHGAFGYLLICERGFPEGAERGVDTGPLSYFAGAVYSYLSDL